MVLTPVFAISYMVLTPKYHPCFWALNSINAGAGTAGRSLRHGFQSSEDCGEQSDDSADCNSWLGWFMLLLLNIDPVVVVAVNDIAVRIQLETLWLKCSNELCYV